MADVLTPEEVAYATGTALCACGHRRCFHADIDHDEYYDESCKVGPCECDQFKLAA